nr:immunoglobulin heavy chain junction region [Macaca mulatta]
CARSPPTGDVNFDVW